MKSPKIWVHWVHVFLMVYEGETLQYSDSEHLRESDGYENINFEY